MKTLIECTQTFVCSALGTAFAIWLIEQATMWRVRNLAREFNQKLHDEINKK